LIPHRDDGIVVGAWRAAMIHGLKVDVKAEELVVQLGARIRHHESKAKL